MEKYLVYVLLAVFIVQENIILGESLNNRNGIEHIITAGL